MDDMSSSTVDIVFSRTTSDPSVPAPLPEREVCTIVNTSLRGGPLNAECLNSSPDFAGDVSLCTTLIWLPLPPPAEAFVVVKRKTAIGMEAMNRRREAQILHSPPAGPSSWNRVGMIFGCVMGAVVASIFVISWIVVGWREKLRAKACRSCFIYV